MLRPGQAIALCVLALLVLGVVMVNSAGMSVEAKYAVTIESILLSRPVAYMGLAVAAMLTVGLLPIRRLAERTVGPGLRAELGTQSAEQGEAGPRFAPPSARDLARHYASLWPLWLGVLALLAIMASVYLPGIGKEVNHSHRWLNLHLPGLESVQPSEFAKWGLIGLIAWYCCRNQRHMSSFWYGLLPGLAAAGAVAGFIVVEDLGTGALVGLVATIVLVAAGARLWHLAVLAPIPLAGMALAIMSNPYRIGRITSFLNPYDEAQGKGYHMIQSMVAVANGQFFGRGLGHGLQKFGYLPEDTTDFLFAIICEELGVFGAALVIFLYGSLLWCVLTVIKREPSPLLRLVGLGVLATVGLQAVINLAVVTGLGPTKGIALPLLSSGGTGWILTAASLGLVIAMDRTQGVMQWYRAPSAPAVTPADTVVIESCQPPATVPDTRFAPPMVATTLESTPISVRTVGIEQFSMASSTSTIDLPPAPRRAASAHPTHGSETGFLFGEPASVQPSVSPVIVTDDARDWPDAARIRPA